MKTISSRSHEMIKQVASLQQKKQRSKHNQFVAEGLRTCTTLIQSGHQPVQLFVTEQHATRAQKLVSDDKITLVPEHVMEKISGATTPSGIVGQFAIPAAPSADVLTPGLVLAQVADPGNMGTLIRTTAALNHKSVIIVEGADPWSPKVVQASAGTIGMVHIFQWSWHDLLANKKAHQLIGLAVKGGKNLSEFSMHNTLLVVGSEAHGIPDQWLADCNAQLTLPMPRSTESLNAAVAGSIALYVMSMRK